MGSSRSPMGIWITDSSSALALSSTRERMLARVVLVTSGERHFPDCPLRVRCPSCTVLSSWKLTSGMGTSGVHSSHHWCSVTSEFELTSISDLKNGSGETRTAFRHVVPSLAAGATVLRCWKLRTASSSRAILMRLSSGRASTASQSYVPAGVGCFGGVCMTGASMPPTDRYYSAFWLIMSQITSGSDAVCVRTDQRLSLFELCGCSVETCSFSRSACVSC